MPIIKQATWNGINRRYGNRRAIKGRRYNADKRGSALAPSPGSVKSLLGRVPTFDAQIQEKPSFKEQCLKKFPRAEARYCSIAQQWQVFKESVAGTGSAYWNPAGVGATAQEAWKSLFLNLGKG